MYSVVSSRDLPVGVIPFQYSGEGFLGDQIPKQLRALDKKINSSWVICENEVSNHSAILIPIRLGNYTRFINATRTDEMHKANLKVFKTRDSNGIIHIEFMVIRPIKKGEHFFYWYGSRVDESEYLTIEDFVNHKWEQV
jgi:hypothetical protein